MGLHSPRAGRRASRWKTQGEGRFWLKFDFDNPWHEGRGAQLEDELVTIQNKLPLHILATWRQTRKHESEALVKKMFRRESWPALDNTGIILLKMHAHI